MLGKRYFKIKGPKLNNIRLLPCGGFTIIEVMVSMAIFSVSILGLAASVTGIMRANQTSYFQTTATNLAQDKLEELKARPAAIASGGPADITVGTQTFTRTWTVNSNSPIGGVSQIGVQVDWTDYTAQSVSIFAAVNQ